MTPLAALNLAREHRVSPAGLHIILALLTEYPVPGKSLSAATGMSPASTTGVCDTLVRDGWIERTPFSRDRRMWYVMPTERAVTTFATMTDPAPVRPDVNSVPSGS